MTLPAGVSAALYIPHNLAPKASPLPFIEKFTIFQRENREGEL